MQVRALLPEDMAAARALVLEQFGHTRYEARMLELLAGAGTGGETTGVVASDAGDDCAGLMLCTTIAGAASVERVDCVLGSDAATSALMTWLGERDGTRLVIAELPDDEPFRASAMAVSSSRFVLEGGVAEFVAEGIDLQLFVMRPRASTG